MVLDSRLLLFVLIRLRPYWGFSAAIATDYNSHSLALVTGQIPDGM